jgi:uncharacterized membrane protein
MLQALWLRIPKHIRTCIVLTLINLAVLGYRNLIVGNHVFCFLKSNLFIGSLPPLIIATLIQMYETKLKGFWFWCLTLLWVLFYPNAPYMISDLIHDGSDPLNATNPQMIVFDTLIIFSIAMLSVYYGLLSLKIMYGVFKKRYNEWFADGAITITIILSCLGFYMGREMVSEIKLGNGYLYSWEMFIEPMKIINAVWDLLFPIAAHKEAYYMMILFGIVQALLLAIFKDISDIKGDLKTKNATTEKQ